MFLHVIFLLLVDFVSSQGVFQLGNLITSRQQDYEGSGGEKFPRNTIGIIRANGYPAETHIIPTEDGYLLEVHRISPKNGTTPPGNRLPVILMPGFLQGSTDWVINSPANNSLGFILADNGYDVWMGNHRGCAYSMKHLELKPSSSEFWDFSFHEMGKYDVPALIDYVLNATSAEKLHYLTFSYSTMALIAGLSMQPELNGKIATAIAMGPSAFQSHYIDGVAKRVSFLSTFIDAAFNMFGTFPILPEFMAKMLNNFIPMVCDPKRDVFGLCQRFIGIFFGNDGGLITKEQFPLIFSVTPSAAGLKPFNHILQMAGSGRFTPYNYGAVKNMELYGRDTPPDYNLTMVQAPIALFVGLADSFGHREDAKKLAELLPNLIEYYTPSYEKFTHLNFCYGREEAAKVYYHAIELMQQRE